MKRPSTHRWVVGHPIIAVPATAVCVLTMFAAIHASQPLVGILMIVLVGAVQTASEEVRAYKKWTREWNAMDQDAPRPRPRRRIPAWLLLTGTPALAFFALACIGGENPLRAAEGTALIGGPGIILAVLWVAIRWLVRRRPPQRARSSTVAIVARPVMAVPSLSDAYRALPSYCHAVMRGQP